MSELTPKQQRFVEEYLIDLNGTQAAIRAGYSPDSARVTASRMLAEANIQEAVRIAKEARRKVAQVDAEYVINGIVNLIQKCESAVPVTDREGNETGEYTIQAGPAMKGYELLSRHLGLLNDKLKVEGSLDLASRLVASRKRLGRGE